MRIRIAVALSAILGASLLAPASSQAAEVAYRHLVITDCQTLLWDTCAIPFHDVRSYELDAERITIPAYCIFAVDPAGLGCLAGVQREVHASRLVGVGQTGGLNIIYTLPPGRGFDVTVATAGVGGRMTVSACNNDAEACPGKVEFEVSVEVSQLSDFHGVTQQCVALVGSGAPIALCARPDGSV